MKILHHEQLKKADNWTIEHEPITSIRLMERAAIACVNWLNNHFPDKKHTFHFYCGKGNNGGDGLAIARLLAAEKYAVDVFIVDTGNHPTPDFLTNLKRLEKIKSIRLKILKDTKDIGELKTEKSTIIIDCLFGTGINKPVEGLAADVISFINRSETVIVSIDVPSGMPISQPFTLRTHPLAIVNASHTLTFQLPKLSFLLADYGNYTGRFTLLDIGLDMNFIEQQETPYHFITIHEASYLLKSRNQFSHKGNYGHACIVAGSYGKAGAALLATKACLRSGAGLVTIQSPRSASVILQTGAPEAMLKPNNHDHIISEPVEVEKYDAIGIGPGIGVEKDTQNVLKVLIQNSTRPLVLDADALNILAENKTWLAFLPKNSILTPHPKEFERLTEKAATAYERLQLQRSFSVKFGVYMVLKGAFSSISTPEGQVFFNSTGNPGMATGGSGDVLTGIITGLLAQGYPPKQAAILGTFLHGLAGDKAAEEMGQEALTAGDIVEHLGKAFLTLHQQEKPDKEKAAD